MLTQMEIEAVLMALPPECRVAQRRAVRKDQNLVDHQIALARALKKENLSPALFHVMLSVARQEVARKYATTVQVCIDLGVSVNAIHIHLHKSPWLFENKSEVRKGIIRRIGLSAEAVELLVKVQKSAKRYANHQD